MKETIAELVDMKDPEHGDAKIYIRFVGDGYKDKERFVLITPDEFNALVKLFVDKIVSSAKVKNEQDAKSKGNKVD